MGLFLLGPVIIPPTHEDALHIQRPNRTHPFASYKFMQQARNLGTFSHGFITTQVEKF